jgi:hypothetical protein
MSDAPITVVLAITESEEHPDFYKLQLSGMGGPFRDAAQTLLAGGRQWLLSQVEEVGPRGTFELTFLGTKPAAPVLVAAEQESSDAAQSRRRSRRHPPGPGAGPPGTAA